MPSLDRAAIDPDADRVVRKLTRAGHKAYLVGGCVRDLLVAKTPKDFDVATSATPNEIKATFRNCRIIGRRFRLAHVFFGSKIIEVSTFRANPRDEDDHDLLIRRDNLFGTETEDARRRDFTINGLFYDLQREEAIDHVGSLPDLDAPANRTTGPTGEAASVENGDEEDDADADDDDTPEPALGAAALVDPVDTDDDEDDAGDEEQDGDELDEPEGDDLDPEEQAWHRVWADEPI